MVFDDPKEFDDPKSLMDFNDPKEFDDPQVFNDPKGILIGSMDFDNSKVYGDTSIPDSKVCLFVVCHICE